MAVAEKRLQFLVIEVPVRDGAVAEVFAEKDIQCTHDVSHHAVADDDDLFEPRENRACFFGAEPPHVAIQWDVGPVEADSAAAGEGP